MKKFEYMEALIPIEWEAEKDDPTKFKPNNTLVSSLNRLGQIGWEVVHLQTMKTEDPSKEITYAICKKQIPSTIIKPM